MSRGKYIPMSERIRIAEYIKLNPDATLTMIGKRFGCSHEAVWRIQQAYFRGEPNLGASGKAERWLKAREKIMAEHHANPELNYAQLGRIAGVSANMVANLLKRHGLKIKRKADDGSAS